MSRTELITSYFIEHNRFRQLGIEQRLIANMINTLARQPQTPFITQTHCRLAALNGAKIQDIYRSRSRIFILGLRIDGYRDNNPSNPNNNLSWYANVRNNNANNSNNSNFNIDNIVITLSLLLLGVLVITSFVFLALLQVGYI